jgi:site-specific recombinase XerD
MNKLVLPKNPYKGLKIFCKTCNKDNANCKHFDSQVYRVRLHVPGSKNSVKTRKIEATDYSDAVIEVIAFEKELNATDFTTIGSTIIENTVDEGKGNDYSIADAVIRYNQYLNGDSIYAHLKKNISEEYRKELLRYCRYFSQNVNKNKDIRKFRIKDVNRAEVSSFYIWAEKKYKEKTLKKCMSTLKGFFEFLIDVEEIEMRNPFRTYVVKEAVSSVIETITKQEFESVLQAVDTADPILKLGGKGEKKHMYRPYLKQAYKLFLLTGCRREELVVMRWSDIYSFDESVKFMFIDNIKVQRIKNRKNVLRPIPITVQLMNLLIDLGYNEKYMTDDYILCPDRDMNVKSLMDFLSKSFTHYWKSTGTNKDYSLKNLRKTHFTWVNKVMGDETKILSSHSSNEVLKKFYLDTKLSSVIKKGALEIKIFN